MAQIERPDADQTRIEAMREGNPENLPDVKIIDYLSRSAIDNENFGERFDVAEMTMQLIHEKKAKEGLKPDKIKEYIEALKTEANDQKSKADIDSLPGRSLEEKIWMKTFLLEKYKIQNAQYDVILRRHHLNSQERTERQQQSDQLFKDIQSQFDGDTETLFNRIKEIEETLREDIYFLNNGPSTPIGPKFQLSLNQRRELSKEKMQKIQEIRDKSQKDHPQLASQIMDYFDIQVELDSNIDLQDTNASVRGTKLRSQLELEQKNLDRKIDDLDENLITVRNHVNKFTSLRQNTTDEPQQSWTDSIKGQWNNIKDFLAQGKKHLFDKPSHKIVPIAALAFIGWGIMKLVSGDETAKFRKGLWRLGILGLGTVVATNFVWGVGPLEAAANYDKRRPERDNSLKGRYRKTFEKISDKKASRLQVQIHEFEGFATRLGTFEVISAYKKKKNHDEENLAKYNKDNEAGKATQKPQPEKIDLTVPDREGATAALDAFFKEYDIDYVEQFLNDPKNFTETTRRDLSFGELMLIIQGNNAALTHKYAPMEGPLDVVSGLLKTCGRTVASAVAYGGLHPFGIPFLDIDSTEEDQKQSYLKAAQAGTASAAESPETGYWAGFKRLATGGWYHTGHQLMNAANKRWWTGGSLIPDSWFNDNRSELIKQIRVERIDDEDKINPNTAKTEKVARGSVNFVKHSVAFEPYRQQFIEPVIDPTTRKTAYERLRPFQIEQDTTKTPPENLAAYVTKKVEIGDLLEISGEVRLHHAIDRALIQARSLALRQNKGITEDHLKYAQLIDAVIFQDQVDASSNTVTKPQLRIFLRIPLGAEYTRLSTGQGVVKPGSAFDTGKEDQLDVADEKHPLTLDKDFPNTVDRLLLLKTFPVKVKYLDDILYYLTKNDTQDSVPQSQKQGRDGLRERILAIPTHEVENIIKAAQAEARIRKGKPTYKIEEIYSHDNLVNFQKYEWNMAKIEDEVIDDELKPTWKKISNIDAVISRFREQIIKPARAHYFIALMEYNKDDLSGNKPELHPLTFPPDGNDPVKDLIPDAGELRATMQRIAFIIEDKSRGKPYSRTPKEILECYREELTREANIIRP